MAFEDGARFINDDRRHPGGWVGWVRGSDGCRGALFCVGAAAPARKKAER
jgi:hypothetical protein